MRLGFQLCDKSGNPLGEVEDATDRNVTFPLSKPRLGGFTVRRDNPLLAQILQADLTLVAVYQDPPRSSTDPAGTRRILGPICSVEKNSDTSGGSLAVVFGGPEVRLGGRLIGKLPSTTGVTYNPGDYANQLTGIGWQMIQDALRAEVFPGEAGPWDHGIRQGAIVTRPATDPSGPHYYKDVLTALTEISTPLDGFDWNVTPIDPVLDSQGVAIGVWNAAPLLGQVRPDCIWEYGTGRHNVASFRHTITSVGSPGVGQTGLCNLAYGLPPGFPDNATEVVQSWGYPDSANTHGLWEAVASSDITADALRLKLSQNTVAVRKNPTQVITFQPAIDPDDGSMLQYGTDYVEGDIVEFRAVEEGQVTIDATFRIYEASFAADENGAVQPTLALVNDGTY